MTLGSGAWHSEQNASQTEPMRFIQIWILPTKLGLQPGVEQKVFTQADRTDRWLRAISGDGGEAVLVHQDVHVFVSFLNAGVSVEHLLGDGRGVYLYVIEGDVTVNDERMTTGDAAEIREVAKVTVEAAPTAEAELILVDVRL
jgi:redox-sensitive bicupin YhaK (pirin superfamily)